MAIPDRVKSIMKANGENVIKPRKKPNTNKKKKPNKRKIRYQ